MRRNSGAHRHQSQRGIALIHTIFVLGALMAMTAVGVDLGHLAFTATEVQTAAEVAATAGAHSMLDGGSAQSGAEIALAQNHVDRKNAVDNLDSIDPGNYDGAAFTPGGTPSNAVRAQASATVDNLLAPVIPLFLGGSPDEYRESTVTKTATASFTSIGSGQPTLPLAIGECSFPNPDCLDDACLPTLTQVPATTNNTAWTGFEGGANEKEIKAFFPSPCGSDALVPVLTAVEDSINLTGGQSNLLKIVECLFDKGLAVTGKTEFLVPVVDNCDGNFNGTYPVAGFATIVIDSVTATGKDMGIDLHAIFNANAPGKPGGGNFGSGFVMLVG